MKYRARCGTCRARKTIYGVFDPNDRVKCHDPYGSGCKGTMGYDKSRNRDGVKDRATKLCYCSGDNEKVGSMSMKNSPHRYGSNGCIHREDHVIERSLTQPLREQQTEVIW